MRLQLAEQYDRWSDKHKYWGKMSRNLIDYLDNGDGYVELDKFIDDTYDEFPDIEYNTILNLLEDCEGDGVSYSCYKIHDEVFIVIDYQDEEGINKGIDALERYYQEGSGNWKLLYNLNSYKKEITLEDVQRDLQHYIEDTLKNIEIAPLLWKSHSANVQSIEECLEEFNESVEDADLEMDVEEFCRILNILCKAGTVVWEPDYGVYRLVGSSD